MEKINLCVETKNFIYIDSEKNKLVIEKELLTHIEQCNDCKKELKKVVEVSNIPLFFKTLLLTKLTE